MSSTDVHRCEVAGVCTAKVTGRTMVQQRVFHCITCYGRSATKVVCIACAHNCHKGHTLRPFPRLGRSFCDCLFDGKCRIGDRTLESVANLEDAFTEQCTAKHIGKKRIAQEIYRCQTCFGSSRSMCVCVPCALKCHAGHSLQCIGMSRSSFCDCPFTPRAECRFASSPQSSSIEECVRQCAAQGICTTKICGKAYIRQRTFRCLTCFPSVRNACVCESCAKTCHQGHNVVPASFRGGAFCDCPFTPGVTCSLASRRLAGPDAASQADASEPISSLMSSPKWAARMARIGASPRTLYHETTEANAQAIISSQQFRRGKATCWAGSGIYFAESAAAARAKAHSHGVVLRATVRLGNVKLLSASQSHPSTTFSSLFEEGYDSVRIDAERSGTEYAVYNYDQVSNIERDT